MSLTTKKNGSKGFKFDSKSDFEVGEMLKQAVRMVREAQEAGGARAHSRMAMLDEVTAEAARRSLNTAALALAA